MPSIELIRSLQRAKGPATIMAIGTANDQRGGAEHLHRLLLLPYDQHRPFVKEKFRKICDKSIIMKRYLHLTEDILKANPNLCAYMEPSLNIRHDAIRSRLREKRSYN